MIDHKELKFTPEQIEGLFRGTTFGPSSDTEIGKRGLMVDCVLKKLAGYRSGYTIETICQEAGLFSPKGNPTKAGINWTYHQISNINCGHGTILEKLNRLREKS